MGVHDNTLNTAAGNVGWKGRWLLVRYLACLMVKDECSITFPKKIEQPQMSAKGEYYKRKSSTEKPSKFFRVERPPWAAELTNDNLRDSHIFRAFQNAQSGGHVLQRSRLSVLTWSFVEEGPRNSTLLHNMTCKQAQVNNFIFVGKALFFKVWRELVWVKGRCNLLAIYLASETSFLWLTAVLHAAL